MRPGAVATFLLVLCTGMLAVPQPVSAADSSVNAPTIELVSPMRVKAGGKIVLRGKNFSSRRVRNTVVFRRGRVVLAKPLAASRRRLVLKVPAAVHKLLAEQEGEAIPTRLRLQVVSRRGSRRSGRIGRRTGPNRSPLVVPRAAPTITSGPPGSTTERSASFAFTSATAASYTCRLDEGAWQGCASPASYSDLELGEHRFSVRAHNAAGDTYASAATRSWTIVAPPKPDAPGVTITSGPPATTSATTATFGFSSTQPGTFECSLDLGQFSACTSPHSYSDLAVGPHEFQVRVTNENGSDVASWRWTVTSSPSQEVNVAVEGTSTDGLTFAGSTTGTPRPAEFVTFEASLSHDPVSVNGPDCVPASGTWSYFDADGDLAAEFAQDSSVDGLYCESSDSYSLYWRQVGGQTNDTGSFTLVYDSVADTFTAQQNGRYTP